MKPGSHRDQPVVFRDPTIGEALLTQSTITSARTIQSTDGGVHTYSLIVLDVSAASQPFCNGARRHVDMTGQVEKFRRRYGRASGG